ncbi:hypothetical protein FA15DRAFT_591012 [Coprinopsis marcescibilis]|uniref:cAMP-independent regulatory protein pac2 n=1 Tax=Coprinopsis marcescibilis TaxID=230819 RepID=A0A5C3KY66_COPMA|nr:hypothetical protein FA15DRAFT_591012 [Coprinopsis marcescibilis]
MQRATATGLRIRSPADARVIFHAVVTDVLPMVSRRLDTEERSLIQPGSVYVWEERGPQSELTGVGIERWTDGIRWGPSRVREGFLFYHEKSQQSYADHIYGNGKRPAPDPTTVLIKQTYTVYVDTPRGQRKWHLIAYFTEEALPRLRSVDDVPELHEIKVPVGLYKSARSAKGRPDPSFSSESDAGNFSPLEYMSYPQQYSPQQYSPPPLSDAGNRASLAFVDHHSRGLKSPRALSYSPTSPDDSGSDSGLAPLAYLQSRPPPRRHPIDEKTLMLFTASGRL